MSIVGSMVDNALREPDSSAGSFMLPCGYIDDEEKLHREVFLRGMTGVEEDILASKRVPDAEKMDRIIGNCLDKLGTITDVNVLKNITGDLTIGDRLFLLYAIRRVSLGDEFPFKETCPSCEEATLYPFDLRALEVIEMKDPEKRSYEEKLPSGKTVVWHPMCGKDNTKRERFKKADLLTLNLWVRIDTLDGKPTSMDTIRYLTTRDRDWLRGRFMEVEGGLETTVEVVCPLCRHEFERDIDISTPGFFFPSETRMNWKRKSSS